MRKLYKYTNKKIKNIKNIKNFHEISQKFFEISRGKFNSKSKLKFIYFDFVVVFVVIFVFVFVYGFYINQRCDNRRQ